MNAFQRFVAAGVLAAALTAGATAGAMADGVQTNAPPPMANPYPYAFFDPAKASPQIVAPPKDWRLDALDGWNWNPSTFAVWPAYCGYGPWGPWWGFSWCPPFPCTPLNVYNLNIRIRF